MPDTLTSVYSTLVAVVSAVAPDLATSAESAVSDLLRAVASAHADVLASQQTAQQAAYSSSATGAALDELAADVGLQRVAALAASGSVQFTGLPNAPAGGWTVPVGTVVSTPASATAGPLRFALQAQVTVPGSGQASGTVLAAVAGASGNVVAGALTQFSAVQGIAAVSNLTGFANGSDAEGDTALRQRMGRARTVLYSAAAIQAAAKGVAGGGQVSAFAYLSDTKNQLGTTTCYAAAADGTLTSGLSGAVQTAVNAVLPVGETCAIAAPGLVYAVVQVSVEVATGSDPTATSTAVVSAILADALLLDFGVTLQPGPMWSYVLTTAKVAGLADWYTTSAIPTVSATQLFRFLAAPLPPLAGAATATQTGYALTSGTGTLAAGTYYVQLAWTDGTHDSMPSAEYALVTPSTGEVTFTAPTAFPANVTGLKVSVSTGAGAEKLQGTIGAAGGTYVLSAAPTTGGAAPATSNTYSQPTVAIVTV